MAWVKTDDRYDDTRKIKRAWRRHPRAVGLHAMSKSYCARHETDGLIDLDWLEDKLPNDQERREVLEVMTGVDLFELLPAGERKRVKVTRVKRGKPVEIIVTHGPLDEDCYVVHDYLEFNESRQEAEERRRADAERKTKARAKKSDDPAAGDQEESAESPDGHGEDSAGSPINFRKSRPDPTRPDPTRPDPTRPQLPPTPPNGGRKRDRERFEAEMAAWREAHPPIDSEEWQQFWTALDGIVDASAIAGNLSFLHLHVAGDEWLVGCRADRKAWISERFGKVILAAAGRPVELIDCGCDMATERAA